MNSSSVLRVCFINVGILLYSVTCIHLGLISPIEVVEEFGCHDTEIRLTCGNLDSKLAILEAAFTPNCTRDECLRFDMKRLVRTFASEETEDAINAEKEAGQKFLDTLRQGHSDGEDVDVDVEESDPTEGNTVRTQDQKRKRTSLRMVLERLIIRYLRRISPEDELDDDRFSRSRRNIPTEIPTEAPETSEEDSIRSQSARPHCDEQRSHISSLNRLDLEKSYRNQSDNEYNIRRVLNKRCSGKNHCSFIFSIDHPFAKVWEGGVVRVKYICMEDFRINRYCGEHLTLGYEIDPNVQILDVRKGDPIAAARIQPRETSLHSLKIIKADKISNSDGVRNGTQHEPRKFKHASPSKGRNEASVGHTNRVYSQDFRVLKILPSNIDDFNDIEKIGDEIYFRKEDLSTEQSNVNELNTSTISSNEAETISESEIETLDETTTLKEELKKSANISNSYEDVTFTIREGEHYVMVYPNISETLAKAPSNLNARERLEGTNVTTAGTNESLEGNSSVDSSTQETMSKMKEYISEEDSDEEELIMRERSRTTYNSVQRTSYRSPLLHGFAMTPGYPKFYIGDYTCQWNIIAPEGIRVWISIIDSSLRYDEVCRDFLQIEDVGLNKTLFNSCADNLQPVGIISTSNSIKVTVKTTSKFAYPKRGVLLHYTGDGCINPPLPPNVKLVDRTETNAFYECQPSFLFPDTGLSTRKLTCNNIHVWDNLLPDCIEQEILSRGAVPSEEKLTLTHKKPDQSIITNKMPSHNEADMLFDIIVPSILIAGLFIANGAIFAIIMKYRKRSKAIGDREMELAEL